MQRSSGDALARQRAIQQFTRLGYSILDGAQEERGPCVITGRRSAIEVVLLPRLRAALRALNPGCAAALIEAAIDALTTNRSLLDLAHANEQIHTMLTDGIKVDARGQLVTSDSESAGQEGGDRQQDTHKTLRIVDWREAGNNDFTLVSHLWVDGKLGKRCLDLVGFVNGLPLILLEIVDSELPHIFDNIDRDYKSTLPALFWYNAFIVVADAFTCKMGSLTTPWERFFQWKRIKDEGEAESSRLDSLIEGTCHKERLLDIIENFTLFNKARGLNKLIAMNHQYLGVNNAIASLRAWEQERRQRRQAGEARGAHGRLGVFWHTQGSGKSYSMVFFVRKVQRTIANNYTFVVVTDREDLDRQIYENFRHTGAIAEDAGEVRARNASHLKRLLSEKHLLLFTLIQKFYSDVPGQDYDEISDNENIIIMADEAHRTQYDTLAKNMRAALPRASFIGFTGTPLMDGEEQTRETFGHYVSIYNFRRAINDSITVPLYYENHTPQIELINDDFQDEMSELLEEAMLDERQEQRVVEQYARAENIVVKGERLDQVAADIVGHFMNRGYMGKAMVVSINKITAVRTYNRVREQWQRYQEELRAQLSLESDPAVRVELAHKINYMERTEMAVVVSPADGDTERFARFSQETGEQIEIATHHQRFKKEKLAENFKDPEHVLRIVFVCAMWITGFDVPPLSTIYLDRPLKGHTLMQAIARANRVYQDKINGLIVDYASTIRALIAALVVYAREDSSGYREGDRPIGDKSDLVQALRDKLAETAQFCRDQGINVQDLLPKLAAERDKQQQQDRLWPTIDKLVAYDDIKLRALLLTSEVSKLYKAILPDAAEREFTLPVHLYMLIKDGIYKTMRPTGFRETLGRVTRLVRESLEVHQPEERLSADTLAPRGSFDLRDIDLNALNTNLRSGHRHIKAEQMRNLLYERIRRMIEVNPSRVKYMEKLDRAIDRYNEGCANFASDPRLLNPQEKVTQLPSLAAQQDQLQDEYTNALVELTGEIAQEEQRSQQEEVSEEELAIFDQLALNVSLSQEEHTQVKQIARTLLAALLPTFSVPDWQKKSQTFSRVRITIEDELLNLPAIYSQELANQKCDDLFLYVQERYSNDGSASVA
ncbi:MAG: type I restriction endonuclease subunit R [Chloroflexota bacterium]|nr:type I restriction endonuclease subunit R [Chloroflexota bacterium]